MLMYKRVFFMKEQDRPVFNSVLAKKKFNVLSTISMFTGL